MSDVVLIPEMVDEYFRDARERHAIYLRRAAGRPKPWTQDPVMQNYSITNVFRELDKTTVHLKTHVRDPLNGHPLLLPAVALYRWFNLIRSGETLFLQPSLFMDQEPTTEPRGWDVIPGPLNLTSVLADCPTPWQEWIRTESLNTLEWPLRKQGAPWVTGSFMIRSPIGMDKLDGILDSFQKFWQRRPMFRTNDGKLAPMGWHEVYDYVLHCRGTGDPVSLAQIHEWLTNFYGLGGFLANEIVSDLRHTIMGDQAPDCDDFNFPGPGALRGAYLMVNGVRQGRKDRLEKGSVREVTEVSRQLREFSRDPKYWPQEVSPGTGHYFYRGPQHEGLYDLLEPPYGDWPAWGGREPGMWLCEFVKIKRTRLGIGRPRGNYRGV